MGISELSIDELKNYFFEFIAKNGDGWGYHIGNFYGQGGWLIQKLEIPPSRQESNPGGGFRQIDSHREFAKKYEEMSWDAAEELEKVGYIKRDRSQRQEGFYKITEEGKRQWEESGELGSGISSSVPDFWNIIHKDVTKVSRKKFEDGHYADAVESALKEVNKRVKEIVKSKTGRELDGASLMTTAFSANNPVISLDDLSSQSGRDVQIGYMQIFAGAMTGIRNPKAHDNIVISLDRATHLIFLASLLMCKLDESI